MDFQSFLSSEDKSVKQTILESCSICKLKKKKKKDLDLGYSFGNV